MRKLLLAVTPALMLAACGGPAGQDPEVVNIQDPRQTGTYAPGAGTAAQETSAAQELLHLLLPGVVGSSPDPLPGIVKLRDKGSPQGTSPDPLPGRTGCQGQGCGRNPGGN